MANTAIITSKYQIFISKGKGVMLMLVPTLGELAGIGQGASTANIRDRKDRY